MPLQWSAEGTVVSFGPFGPGPDTISDLEIWFSAEGEAGMSDNTEMSTWTDRSGNGRDATGVVDTSIKPLWHNTTGATADYTTPPNGKAYVSMYDGALGGYFTLPNFLTGFSAGHGFAVARNRDDPVPGGADCAPPMSDFGSAGDEYWPFPTDQGVYDGWGSNVRKTTGDPAAAMDQWLLYEIRSEAGAWSSYFNGTLHFSTASNTVAWGTAPKIGFTTTNTKRMRGWVAEIFMYSRVLTSGEIATLKAYITAKYSLTIA